MVHLYWHNDSRHSSFLCSFKYSKLDSNIPGLAIPDYMPFWLNPNINPMETNIELLSQGYNFEKEFDSGNCYVNYITTQYYCRRRIF